MRRPAVSTPTRLLVAGDAHGENLGDEVAEGVGGVGAAAVLFVEFACGGVVGIDGPGDFFEIADEFFATGIDEEAAVAVLVAEAGVDAVDTVADEWVLRGVVEAGFEGAFPGAEEFLDENPIRGYAGGVALVAAGVAVYFD